MSQSEERVVALDTLTLCAGLQLRLDPGETNEVVFNEERVEYYVERYADGREPQPLEVVEEVDTTGAVTGRLLVIKGFHRWEALRRLGRTQVKATVFRGTYNDAILFVCNWNRYRARYDTPAEQQRVVQRFLQAQKQAGYTVSEEVAIERLGYPPPAKIQYTRDMPMYGSTIFDHFFDPDAYEVVTIDETKNSRNRRQSNKGRASRRTRSSSRSDSTYRNLPLLDTSDDLLETVFVTWRNVSIGLRQISFGNWYERGRHER